MAMDTAFAFDRFRQPSLDDPYSLYDLWVMTRYDDVRAVLTGVGVVGEARQGLPGGRGRTL